MGNISEDSEKDQHNPEENHAISGEGYWGQGVALDFRCHEPDAHVREDGKGQDK